MAEYYRKIKLGNTPPDEKKLFQLALDELQPSKGIEIGVLNGENCRHLLNVSSSLILFGIDPLIPDSMAPNLKGSLSAINKNTKEHKTRFKFIHNYSYNVSKEFKNESLDFVFIDGSHFYKDVKQDFELYYPKVKKGGMIFLHDSRMQRGGANFHVDPSRYCNELVSNNKNIKLIGEAFSLTCFEKL